MKVHIHTVIAVFQVTVIVMGITGIGVAVISQTIRIGLFFRPFHQLMS